MIRLLRLQHYIQAVRELYSKKNKYYERTGRRLLEWGQITERLSICATCDHFNGLRCGLCGCCAGAKETHFNKLAFPTECCPDTPPRWKEVT